MYKNRYAITFAEVVDSHFGCQQIGNIAQSGFNVQELTKIKQQLQDFNIQCRLIKLHEVLPEKDQQQNQAVVLHVKKFLETCIFQEISNQLYKQQEEVKYDTKFYDGRMKKTMTKRARYNIVFGEQDREASQDFKVYTVKSFKSLKFLSLAKDKIKDLFGEKAKNLNAEGNKYFQEKSGMGFHGDCERKIVISLSVGRKMTMRFFWRKPGSTENKIGPIDLELNHGDLYVMSEKATGNDWKKRSRYRVVHGVGSKKYIGE